MFSMKVCFCKWTYLDHCSLWVLYQIQNKAVEIQNLLHLYYHDNILRQQYMQTQTGGKVKMTDTHDGNSR